MNNQLGPAVGCARQRRIALFPDELFAPLGRVRAGAVYTVPFSEVTTAKNMTKGFAYAVARIAVTYAEDIDRVAEILRRVCDELKADEELGPWILDPCDYQGVDSLDESSLALLLRVRTVAGKQFIVGRSLNRLIKIAFERHGIAMRDGAPIALADLPTQSIAA